MRFWLAASVVASCMVLLAQSVSAEDVPDPGSPHYANRMIGEFVTPTVAPGETAVLRFNVTYPYSNVTDDMVNVTVTVGIYMYATQDESEPVTDTFPNPPLLGGVSTEHTETVERIAPLENPTDLPRLNYANFTIPITTTRSTPHGSYFSQSTYFIRLRIAFNFEGNDTRVVLQSRGWFTDEQWDSLVSWQADEPMVNTTYMRSLGVDGLIPDTSFGIKAPIPRWPLAVVVAGAGGLCSVGLYFYVLDNPGRLPRLEKRFYYLRGKLRELRGNAKDRRGK